MTSDQGKSQNVRHSYFTQEQMAELANDSLGKKLKVVIDGLPNEGVSLAEIRDLFGQDGLLLLTAFLTIPFMVPVSIPGVSTVFGAAILLIGISRLFGRNLWLPRRFEERVLPAERLRAGLNQGLKFFHQLERLTCPHRFRNLTSNGLRGTINNFSIVIGAVFLMAPFGLIPFSNTLPGLALLLLAIGLLQHDGLFILFGHLVNVATFIYFLILIAGGTMIFQKVLSYFMGAS